MQASIQPKPASPKYTVGNTVGLTLLAMLTEEERAILDFERAHFFRYGEWSLDFEIVYHFKSPDYILHMDAQQAILLEIYRAFERERIQFAHPLSVIRVAEPTDPAGGWLPHAVPRTDELKH